jgi:hypothetical protein
MHFFLLLELFWSSELDSPKGGCDSFPFPSFLLDLLGAILDLFVTSRFTRMRSGAAERGGEIRLAWGLSQEVKAEHGSDWGLGNYSAD